MASLTSFTVEDGSGLVCRDPRRRWSKKPCSLCRIPGPTFDEAERAAYAEARMRAIGLDDVQVDDIYNVTGVILHGPWRRPRQRWLRLTSIPSFRRGHH